MGPKSPTETRRDSPGCLTEAAFLSCVSHAAHIPVTHEDRQAKGQVGSSLPATKNSGGSALLQNSIRRLIKEPAGKDEKAGTFPIQINTVHGEPPAAEPSHRLGERLHVRHSGTSPPRW